MLLIDVDAELAGHLSVAIRVYRNRASRAGINTPKPMAELEKVLAARASEGQRGTPVAHLWSVAKTDPMICLEGAGGTRLVGYAGAAELLGCSVRTVKRLVASGALPVVRLGDRLPRVQVGDIERLIQSRRSTTP